MSKKDQALAEECRTAILKDFSPKLVSAIETARDGEKSIAVMSLEPITNLIKKIRAERCKSCRCEECEND